MASRKKNKNTDKTESPLLRIVSLGCAKNFVDTEVATGSLLCAGFGLTPFEEEADILLVNTCAFLKEAREEAESVIIQAEHWKEENPNRKIIVSGCIVEWDKDNSFRKRHPEVDAWTGIDAVSDLGKIASAVWNNSIPEIAKSSKKYLYNHSTARIQLTAPHYAYIKIADGCDNCCSYCMIIPSIRGPLRSRDAGSVVKEAESLIANGVRELILIAQDSSAFGRDKGKLRLAELLEKLDALEGDFHIRLMYLHPASVDDALLETMAKSKHLIRCLEMPLQHISGPLLKSMNRKITEEATRKLIKRITNDLGFSLRTTFLIGFPGETEQDHEILKKFVRETKFTRLGAFAYSREEGTPAYDFAQQVEPELAEKRRAEIMRIQSEISLEFNRALIGKTVDVIIDEMTGTAQGTGRTLFDAPDIDNIVRISGARGCAAGEIVKLKVDQASEYEISGKVVKINHSKKSGGK